jgi:NADH dehydrogenase
VVVTGANGHLGRRLIRRLRQAPAASPVRAIVRSEAAAAVLQALPGAWRPEIVVVDYGDEAGLARAFRGSRAVVHLVGILKETATTKYAQAHETTASTVAKAAAESGVGRIVYLSILGATPDSRNPCLRSKGRAERILLEREVPSVILRVPMVLGPGDVASRALRGQALARWLPLVRGGACLEQPIDADDVVAAVCSALDQEGLAGAAFDLAGPECLTHRELVMRAASLWGRKPRVVPVPLRVVRLLARIAQRALAEPPLTVPMLDVLERDDHVDPGPACARLGVELTPLARTLARCVGPAAEPA